MKITKNGIKNVVDKIFLTKKIVSKEGKLHFRRWALIQTPLLSVYIHHVAKSDEERDPHDHPWDFISLVLKNGYTEKVWDSKDRNSFKTFVRNPGKIVYHKVSQFHQLKLNSEGAWTLVVAGRRKHNLWGYLTENGWVDNVTYRKQKNSKNLA